MVDVALVFGVLGTVLGVGSIVYARTQAAATERQANEERRVAEVEVTRALAERVRETRAAIVANPRLWTEYREANPQIAKFYDEGTLDAMLAMRGILETFQDVWILRREGIIGDAYWRNWVGSLAPLARMPSARAVFANMTERELLDPGFAAAFRGLINAEAIPDPLAPR